MWRGTGHFVARLLSDYEFQLSKSGELEHKMKEMLEASHIKVGVRPLLFIRSLVLGFT